MAHKKFEVANGTTYQEYIYFDGQSTTAWTGLTKQSYHPPVYQDYTYYYRGTYEFNDDDIAFVEIISYQVGSNTIQPSPSGGSEIIFSPFDVGGCYYNESDNTLEFWGYSNVEYPTIRPSSDADGRATIKIYKKGQDLHGEIYDHVYIDDEDMMPMSNTVEDNNTETVPYNDVYIDYDSYSFGIYVDNSSNSFPIYITFDSGYFATSGGNYYLDDCDWSNQAIGAGESKCVWFCDPAEELTSADVTVTVSAPGYQSEELELEA